MLRFFFSQTHENSFLLPKQEAEQGQDQGEASEAELSSRRSRCYLYVRLWYFVHPGFVFYIFDF